MMPLMKITNILAIGGCDAYVLTEVSFNESENTITVSINQDPISDDGSANLMGWIRASYETPSPPDPGIHIKQMAQYDTLLHYYELEKPILIECEFGACDHESRDQRMTLEIKYKSKKLYW